jgi:hypothetical protein
VVISGPEQPGPCVPDPARSLGNGMPGGMAGSRWRAMIRSQWSSGLPPNQTAAGELEAAYQESQVHGDHLHFRLNLTNVDITPRLEQVKQ